MEQGGECQTSRPYVRKSRGEIPAISVIIPTRDRPEASGQTLTALRRQTLASFVYEIIVVDDGSTPSVRLHTWEGDPACSVIRLEGRERSAARNAGARAARSECLSFVDDDISVVPDFLEAHLSAQREWSDALVIGSVCLPKEALARPFGRFRQALEVEGIPHERGLTDTRNFCTAQNMSMRRERFLSLGGFDEDLVSAEDQDLALRHCEREGVIVFVPEAAAVHRDEALDIRSYSRRSE